MTRIARLAMVATAALAVSSSSALADNGLGVGGQLTLTGASGLSLTYDTDQFHIDGLFGLIDEGDPNLFIGGRFYYGVHDRAGADLSIGGGLVIENDQDDNLDLHFEVGAKIRMFIVPNVSISAVIGLGVEIDNEDMDGAEQNRLVINGQPLADTLGPLGAFGFTYYFQ